MEKNEEIEIPEDENLGELDENTDWKSKATELQNKYREAGIRNRERTKALKDKLTTMEKDLTEFKKIPEKSNEPDYARLAFLEQRGLNHPDDQKLVQDEATRLKLPLTDVLNMGHIKSQLESAKETREAKAGMPKGAGNTGGQSMQDVDYWLAKGETPENLELAEKVINARIARDKSGNMFSDELYS